MRTHSLKARTLILCLACARAIPAFCGGQSEEKLSEVERLITQKEYDKASALIAQIRSENPDMKEDTDRLIQQIFAEGERINEKKQDLLNVLKEDRDVQKAMALIEELKQMDPGLDVKAMLKAATFVFNANEFGKLMDNAAELLRTGRYEDAIAQYLLPLVDQDKAGFDMQKSDFDEAGWGRIVQDSVRNDIARIVAAAGNAAGAEAGLRSASRAAGELLKGKVTGDSIARFEELLSPIRGAALQEGEIRAAAKSLKALIDSIKETNAGGKEYLNYIMALCIGRENRTEGMALAIQLLWEEPARAMADATVANALESFAAARTEYDSEALAAAEAGFTEAYFRGILAVKSLAVRGGEMNPSPGWVFSPAEAKLRDEILTRASGIWENAAETSAYGTLIRFRQDFDSFAAVAEATEEQLKAARGRLQTRAEESEARRREWQARADAWSSRAKTLAAVLPLSSSALLMAGRFEAFSADVLRKDLAHALRLAEIGAGGFEPRFTEAVGKREKGRDLMNGTVGGKAPEQLAELRPSWAADTFREARRMLDDLAKDLDSYTSRWRNEKPYVTASVGLSALFAGINDLSSRIATENKELDRLTLLADDQHLSALSKKKEADQVFNESNKAFEKKLYDNAKLQLSDARDLYFDSLSLEEDAAARTRYLGDIPDLFDRINNTILAQYIAEVDALIDEAKKQFNTGDFLKASLTLKSAQKKWIATQGDRPNKNLDDLIARVLNALRLSGSRELASDDTRAPAVNNFLNLAGGKVTAAEKLPKSDPARKQLLDEAAASAQLALNLAPAYRGATALQLRIKKLSAKDDKAFAETAGKEIAEILKDYKNKTGSRGKVYFALVDFQDILPNYPGLKDAIGQLEIELGFRIKPPTQAEIKDAQDRFDRASKLYDPANQLSYQPALQLLDDALSLDPGNKKAIALRRTILLKQGSLEVNRIAEADLKQYEEAKRLFNNNLFRQAKEILDDLVSKNAQNASFSPIVSLLKETRRQLGL